MTTPDPAATGDQARPPEPGAVAVALRINGAEHRLALEPRVTLLNALREHLRLTGTKKGCDQGQCGACTVHIDGRRALACLTLAAQAEGREVSTIEGLAGQDGALHPVQAAFLEHDAFQCGYCTPGQIMSAVACIAEGHAASDADIREFMSGNLCRCGAYPHIVAAVRAAAAGMAAPGREAAE
jgi:xanthine dehydrogenase YagT iron-sulfur-binding subunit